MDAWVAIPAPAALPAPVQHASPIAEGATVASTAGQSNGSILLNPSGNRTAVTLQLPPAPADGQILTIRSTRSITTLTLVPAVANAASGMAAGDQYQVKWYAATSDWSVIK